MYQSVSILVNDVTEAKRHRQPTVTEKNMSRLLLRQRDFEWHVWPLRGLEGCHLEAVAKLETKSAQMLREKAYVGVLTFLRCDISTSLSLDSGFEIKPDKE